MIQGDAFRALAGLGAFLLIAWGVSENRRRFPWKMVAGGLSLQIVFALVLTRVPAVVAVLGGLARGVDNVQKAAESGAVFVFGYLGGGRQPFAAAEGGASTFIFALQVIPAVLLVSALAALLWHWGVLRWIVQGAAWVFGRLFGVSGPVGVSTSACIFLGMIEAPLLVRPMLPKLSRGEFFIIMVDGLSVIAGSTMILLATMLVGRVDDVFTHLLTASLISTPMAITMARIIIPSEVVRTSGRIPLSSEYKSSLDAITQGTLGGVRIAAYVIALLIVFVGLIALVDALLAQIPRDGDPITLSTVFGTIFAPFAWLMGVPSGDITTVGSLLGTKVAVNEVIAYGQLAALPAGALSARGELIATYALCSFGNFGSVAILIGTLTAMAPEKSDDIVQLGLKALFAAFLTSCMTGTVIGLLALVI
ncbi:NupC/NupG family nucleoside CNT transporter [Novosphingobium aquimarinum]|uniref:NupC/NupG family nucleoside CNT transporter n=1 Tax=Novosphingobium aquimarinum TaxID=2682494 RepID=UPI0012EBD273|nr:nucleoside transporter C-terminal domain-containing protein [Novosphingobium aquimarinum]